MGDSFPRIKLHNHSDLTDSKSLISPQHYSSVNSSILPALYRAPRAIANRYINVSTPALGVHVHPDDLTRPPSTLKGIALSPSSGSCNAVFPVGSSPINKKSIGKHLEKASMEIRSRKAYNPSKLDASLDHKNSNLQSKQDSPHRRPRVNQPRPAFRSPQHGFERSEPSIELAEQSEEEEEGIFKLTERSKGAVKQYEKYLKLCNYRDLDCIGKLEDLKRKLSRKKFAQTRSINISTVDELQNRVPNGAATEPIPVP